MSKISDDNGKATGKKDEKIKTEKASKEREKKKSHVRWIFTVLILTLVLSFLFSLGSELVLSNAHVAVAYAIVVLLVAISIVFDMIGTSSAACDIEPFLSMAARKVRGAKKAMKLAKNAEKVSSICSDIIGDICGIVSGACMATIVAMQFLKEGASGTQEVLISVLFSAVLSAVTVTGKALGKRFAINNANGVIFAVAKVLSVFERKEKNK